MTINIAICNRKINELNNLNDILTRNSIQMDVETNVDLYITGRELINAIANHTYHIYILDIEMQPDSFHAAEFIRSKNKIAIIIFLITHKEMLQRTFDVSAFDYITKPFKYGEILKVFNESTLHILNTYKMFHFWCDGKKQEIYRNNIIYFKSVNRQLVIYTSSQVYTLCSSLQDVLDKIDLDYFFQTHQSYIVNLEWIDIFEGKYVILKNEMKIPMDKSKIHDFNMSYHRFIMRRH